jgi:hypothetical protein
VGREARRLEARCGHEGDFRAAEQPRAGSPDGQWLAARKHFTSRRSLGAGEIWLYHQSSGGEGLQLTTRRNEQKDLGEPAFSPDGATCTSATTRTGGSSFEYSKDSNGQIYAIDRLDRTTASASVRHGSRAARAADARARRQEARVRAPRALRRRSCS